MPHDHKLMIMNSTEQKLNHSNRLFQLCCQSIQTFFPDPSSTSSVRSSTTFSSLLPLKDVLSSSPRQITPSIETRLVNEHESFSKKVKTNLTHQQQVSLNHPHVHCINVTNNDRHLCEKENRRSNPVLLKAAKPKSDRVFPGPLEEQCDHDSTSQFRFCSLHCSSSMVNSHLHKQGIARHCDRPIIAPSHTYTQGHMSTLNDTGNATVNVTHCETKSIEDNQHQYGHLGKFNLNQACTKNQPYQQTFLQQKRKNLPSLDRFVYRFIVHSRSSNYITQLALFYLYKFCNELETIFTVQVNQNQLDSLAYGSFPLTPEFLKNRPFQLHRCSPSCVIHYPQITMPSPSTSMTNDVTTQHFSQSPSATHSTDSYSHYTEKFENLPITPSIQVLDDRVYTQEQDSCDSQHQITTRISTESPLDSSLPSSPTYSSILQTNTKQSNTLINHNDFHPKEIFNYDGKNVQKTPTQKTKALKMTKQEILVSQCGRRIFLGCLILANKYQREPSPSNQAWAKLSQLSIQELNSIERTILKVLDYNLFVSRSSFESWSQWIFQGLS